MFHNNLPLGDFVIVSTFTGKRHLTPPLTYKIISLLLKHFFKTNKLPLDKKIILIFGNFYILKSIKLAICCKLNNNFQLYQNFFNFF